MRARPSRRAASNRVSGGSPRPLTKGRDLRDRGEAPVAMQHLEVVAYGAGGDEARMPRGVLLIKRIGYFRSNDSIAGAVRMSIIERVDHFVLSGELQGFQRVHVPQRLLFKEAQ